MSGSLQKLFPTEEISLSTVSFPAANPFLWWHLLSLDAPTVAATWTWFIGRSAHVPLPWTAPFAMFLGVWVIYASDRLLDGIKAETALSSSSELEARHVFHALHRIAFLLVIPLALMSLVPLLIRMPVATLKLYASLGLFQLAWFIIIHWLARKRPEKIPKEFAVGVFFAAAVFIPTVSRMPSLRLSLLPWALSFTCLCSLNCLFIFAWEHRSLHDEVSVHPTTRIALRFLEPLAYVLTVAPLLFAASTNLLPWSLAAALSLASASLLVLNRLEEVLGCLRLRALADLALLTPLIALALLR